MAYKLYDEDSIKDIADAIREKTEVTDTFTVGEMGEAVRAIETGGGSAIKTINYTDEISLFNGLNSLRGNSNYILGMKLNCRKNRELTYNTVQFDTSAGTVSSSSGSTQVSTDGMILNFAGYGPIAGGRYTFTTESAGLNYVSSNTSLIIHIHTIGSSSVGYSFAGYSFNGLYINSVDVYYL